LVKRQLRGFRGAVVILFHRDYHHHRHSSSFELQNPIFMHVEGLGRCRESIGEEIRRSTPTTKI
ncbi:hypothetical protein WG66_003140, partial [Moniliophthora roreri]